MTKERVTIIQRVVFFLIMAIFPLWLNPVHAASKFTVTLKTNEYSTKISVDGNVVSTTSPYSYSTVVDTAKPHKIVFDFVNSGNVAYQWSQTVMFDGKTGSFGNALHLKNNDTLNHTFLPGDVATQQPAHGLDTISNPDTPGTIAGAPPATTTGTSPTSVGTTPGTTPPASSDTQSCTQFLRNIDLGGYVQCELGNLVQQMAKSVLGIFNHVPI